MDESADAHSLSQKFGATVRRLRKAGGFSQEAFADHCGLHRTTMSLIERGNHAVTLQTVAKIATGLEISLSKLFSELEKEG